MLSSDQQGISEVENEGEREKVCSKKAGISQPPTNGRISALYKPQWRRLLPMENLPMALLIPPSR
jgi:hypothetical protein